MRVAIGETYGRAVPGTCEPWGGNRKSSCTTPVWCDGCWSLSSCVAVSTGSSQLTRTSTGASPPCTPWSATSSGRRSAAWRDRVGLEVVGHALHLEAALLLHLHVVGLEALQGGV